MASIEPGWSKATREDSTGIDLPKDVSSVSIEIPNNQVDKIKGK